MELVVKKDWMKVPVHEVRQEVERIKTRTVQLVLDAWELLSAVKKRRLWGEWGFSGFVAFMQTEFHVSLPWAKFLSRAIEKLSEGQVTVEELESQGVKETLQALAMRDNTATGKHDPLTGKDMERIDKQDGFWVPAAHAKGSEREWVNDVLTLGALLVGIPHWQRAPKATQWAIYDCFFSCCGQEKVRHRELPNADKDWWLATLERDGYRCVKCEGVLWLHVHHIERRSQGGTDDEWNLETLCWECHWNKHVPRKPNDIKGMVLQFTGRLDKLAEISGVVIQAVEDLATDRGQLVSVEDVEKIIQGMSLMVKVDGEKQ